MAVGLSREVGEEDEAGGERAAVHGVLKRLKGESMTHAAETLLRFQAMVRAIHLVKVLR